MKLNKRGFTLVELLVTIAIVGLVIGISTYGIITAINSYEDKSKTISLKNIKEAASIYSGEAASSSWKNADSYDAFCVTVGELMNKGLLDSNAKIKDKVDRNTFVIVKRNKVTLTIEGENIVGELGTEENEICTGQKVAPGEDITTPKITGSTSHTDQIIIDFNAGSAKYQGKTSNVSYTCLYGDSSTNITKEAVVEGNSCKLSNLKSNKPYYVYIYMETEHGSVVSAESSSNEYRTADFNSAIFTQNKNTVTVNYNDKDTNGNTISPVKHYVKSNTVGVTSINVKKCTLDNNIFNCNEGTNNIEANVWYEVPSASINITYAEETNNNIEISTRIYDGSNNYKENKENFVVNKYIVKFYKNSADSIDGKTSEYIEKYCISGGNDSCSITSPVIVKNNFTVVGFNTNSNGTSSTWNTNTTKNINDNATYYAITKKDITITFEKNGATSIGSTSQKCTIWNQNTSCTITSPTITRSGYNVVGWNTNSNGTSSAWDVNTAKIVNSNATYHAITKKNVTISFEKNGATSIGSTSQKCIIWNQNTSCNITSPTITRNGYIIIGWNTSEKATTSTWDVGVTKSVSKNARYYAITKANKVYIRYNVNEGTVTTSTSAGKWSTDTNGLIYKDGSIYTETINYGGKLTSDGLSNYNNLGWLHITRAGSTVTSGKEWICLSGACVGKIYDHSVVYKASDFCDASNGDCTVTLGVNWVLGIRYQHFYDNNGDARTAVYNIVKCDSSNCTYDSLNGLLYPGSDYSLNITTVNGITNRSETCSGCGNGLRINLSTAYASQYYMVSSTSCYSAASTNSSFVKTISSSCSRLTNIYRTTMKVNSTDNWYYSPNDNCYFPGTNLQYDAPSWCSGGGSSDSGSSDSTGGNRCGECSSNSDCGTLGSCSGTCTYNGSSYRCCLFEGRPGQGVGNNYYLCN